MKKIETTNRPTVGAAQTRSQSEGPGNVHQSQKEAFDKLMNKKGGDGKKERRTLPQQSEKHVKQESKLHPNRQTELHGRSLHRKGESAGSGDKPAAPGQPETEPYGRSLHRKGESAGSGDKPAAPGQPETEIHGRSLHRKGESAGSGDKPAAPGQPEQQAKPRGHSLNLDKPSGKITHGKNVQHDQAQTAGENIGEKMLRARGASSTEASAEVDTPALAMTAAANTPTPTPPLQEIAAAPAPSATRAAAMEIDQLIDKTVSRILVSPPESGQLQEVRLQLDGKLLGGTEVRLYNMNGQLNVEFLPQTADAGNFLSQQHGHIQETLSKNLKQQKVLVGINHDAQKEQGETRKERRVERKQGTESF